jgi:Na+-driven multidrug efflux pump
MSGIRAPSMVQVLIKIMAIAIPFALGAAVTSSLNLGKVALLSRAPDTGALHELSLLQPSFVLILAIMEGLAITNQVFSAKSRNNWPRRGVLRASRRLSIVGVIVFVAVAAIGYAVPQFIEINDPILAQTVDLFPLFVLSMILFAVFDIYFGAMRGQGRIMLGLLPFVGLVVIDLTVTYVLVSQYGWGFEAVLLGNLVGAGLMLPVIMWLLKREVADGEDSPDQPFRIRMRQLQIGVGIPVFSSLVVGFISASVAFPILAKLGQEQVSAFFVILRYRIAFMIPAIAIGSAIAILVNQAAEEEGDKSRLSFLSIGVPVMLVLYIGATLGLSQWSGILNLLVPVDADAALRSATETMFSLLLVTFFLVSGSAMLQVILEQLGRGGQVFAITVVIELGTCGVLVWAMQDSATVSDIATIFNGFALLGFVLFGLQMLLLMRKLKIQQAETSDAV